MLEQTGRFGKKPSFLLSRYDSTTTHKPILSAFFHGCHLETGHSEEAKASDTVGGVRNLPFLCLRGTKHLSLRTSVFFESKLRERRTPPPPVFASKSSQQRSTALFLCFKILMQSHSERTCLDSRHITLNHSSHDE